MSVDVSLRSEKRISVQYVLTVAIDFAPAVWASRGTVRAS